MLLVHINLVAALLQRLVTLVIQAITVWTALLATAVSPVIVEIVQAVTLGRLGIVDLDLAVILVTVAPLLSVHLAIVVQVFPVIAGYQVILDKLV